MERKKLNEFENYVLNFLRQYSYIEDGCFKIKVQRQLCTDYVELCRVDESTMNYEELFKKSIPHISVRYQKYNNRNFRLTTSFLSETQEYLRYLPFDPPHIRFTKMNRKPPAKKLPLKGMPSMLIDLPRIIAMVDGVRMLSGIDPLKLQSGLGVCYGTRLGVPNAIVTGTDLAGYRANLTKIASNICEPKVDRDNDYYVRVVMRMLSITGFKNKNRIKFEVPTLEQLAEAYNGYNTSVGYVPWVPKEKDEMSADGNIHYTQDPKHCKKKHIGMAAARFVLEHFDYIISEIEKGNICTKPFFGESICKLSIKDEILNGLTIEKLEELLKEHSKGRFFFIEDALHMLISKIVLDPIFLHLRDNVFGIGIKLGSGGFQAVLRRHLKHGRNRYIPEGRSCLHMPDKDFADALDLLYMDYPELMEREMFEADVIKFDQSLLYKPLEVVGMFLSCFYDVTNDSLGKILLSDVCFRLGVKYLHMLGMDKFFIVMGMMFSGKLETSTCNTLYQFFVFACYLTDKLDEYADSPYFPILQLCILHDLITFVFTGDDTLGSYPTILTKYFNISYLDYQKFAANYGLIFKYNRLVKMLGEAHFYSQKGIWYEDIDQHVTSSTYLKNQVVQVYENDIFQGIFPYRPFHDIVFRLGNSDRASDNAPSICAKMMSLSGLSVGNRMCYQYMEYAFKLLHKVFPLIKTVDVKRCIKDNSNSSLFFSAHEMINDDEFDCRVFPSLSRLRMAQYQEARPVRMALTNYRSGIQLAI